MILSFIKQPIKKEEGMIIYSIYKNNHPVTPPRVVMCLTQGIWAQKRTLEQLSAFTIQKEKKPRSASRRNRIQHKSFKKENSSGTYYQQIEKVQDTCRCIQKQIEKAQQSIRYSCRSGKLQNIKSAELEIDIELEGIVQIVSNYARDLL